MTLLRFEPTAAINDSHGITPQQIDAYHAPLAAIREQLAPFDHAEQLLLQYDALREKSELGELFVIANRLHDHLDAVAVIGDPDDLLAPAALMQACCEPYHNELTRAARGSKPRMYFTESGIDNDAVEGMLRRLRTDDSPHIRHDPIPTPAQRYALIASGAASESSSESSAGDETSRSIAIVQQLFIDQLTTALGDTAPRWLPKLIIPLVDRRLRSPAAPAPFSPTTLLPAAFLGLDCIQFLLGATAISRHFHTAPPHENILFRYVAVQTALAKHRGRTTATLNVWNPALQKIGLCYQQILPSDPAITLKTASLLRTHARWAATLPADVQTHHLLVEASRTDPIPLPSPLTTRPLASPLLGNESTKSEKTKSGKKRRNEASPPTLPDRLRSTIANAEQTLARHQHPSTRLILPRLDPHALGQLFQLWIISAELIAIVLEPDSVHNTGVWIPTS